MVMSLLFFRERMVVRMSMGFMNIQISYLAFLPIPRFTSDGAISILN